MTGKRVTQLKTDKLWIQRTDRLASFCKFRVAPLITECAGQVLETAYGGTWGSIWFMLSRGWRNWSVNKKMAVKIRWWKFRGKDPLVELDREAEELEDKS